MDVTLPVADFKAAMTTAKAFIGRRNYLPVLSCAKLAADEAGNLTVTTTDLDGGVIVTLPATVTTAGASLVNFKTLMATLPKGKGKGDLVLCSVDDDEINVTNGHTSTLRTDLLADFPVHKVIGADPDAIVQLFDLDTTALALAVAAAGTEDSRPILTSVYLTDGEMVGTDSYRLHVAKVSESFPNILLPGNIARAIIKAKGPARLWVATTTTTKTIPGQAAYQRRYGGGMVEATPDREVEETAQLIEIQVGNIRWWTKAVEGTYPSYKTLIPKSYPNKVTCNKAAIMDAVSHVKTAAREKTTPVRLNLTHDSMKLEVITQDVGHASATIATSYDGPDFVIAFNPAYLLDALAAGTSPMVTIEFSDSLKPGMVRDVGSSPCDRLLMPVRVS